MKNLILILLTMFIWQTGFANIYHPKDKKKRRKVVTETISYRENCNQPTEKFYHGINNVRAILTNGGDVWTENSKGRYIVPKREYAEDEVSALYSGAVWIGGKTPSGNTKIAIADYRNKDEYDFYAGPLDEDGQTDKSICERWDKYFKVYGDEIDLQKINYKKALEANEPMNCDSIPDGVKYWPARGNEFFYEEHKFQLPIAADLAPFYDQNENDIYEPCDGDYPIISMEAPGGIGECPLGVYADEMFFWVYNDAGGPHLKSHGDKIGMEVQVEAFAWATNDEINDMTFQRYKLINRASSDIQDCYFAWWVDPDLGCHLDDFIGCVPPPVNLMFVYNSDAVDGSNGCSCTANGDAINTYCERIPLIGVDYFRGPQAHFNFKFDSLFRTDTIFENGDTNFVRVFTKIDTTLLPIGVEEEGDTILELGMTSFIYYNGDGESDPATKGPETVDHYYNLLRGYWKEGTPITFGGTGYNPESNDTIKYVYPDAPNDPNGWSMVTANSTDADRRTIQATGPFVLKPGDVNELIIGVPWVPNQAHPAPALDALLVADELAQALFDNCFKLQDGPTAPDVDIVELDRQLILVLTNDVNNSNNTDENFSEAGLKIDPSIENNLYHFEGYQVYQLISGDVSVQELNDFERARLVFQSDIKNGIGELYNWKSIENPSPNGAGEKIYIPIKKVVGADEGLRHVINITKDQFGAQEGLINHKTYYYIALAYETNNWKEFNPTIGEGQREPYFPGRENVKIYKAVPRPIEYAKLNIKPGDGTKITRVEGLGISDKFVELTEESEEQILADNFTKDIVYKEKFGPFEVEVFNPLDIKDKEYKLELYDQNMNDDVLDSTAYWVLTDLETGVTYYSDTTINESNQQVIYGEGFTVTIKQSTDVFNVNDKDFGVIGSKLVYKDPNSVEWMGIIGDDSGIRLTRFPDGTPVTWDVTNFMKTGKDERDQKLDPNRAFNEKMREAPFAPYWLTDFSGGLSYMISPAARKYMGNLRLKLYYINGTWKEKMNNVDIVFTSDKSKWSRCVVIEESYKDLFSDGITEDVILDVYDGMILGPEGDAEQFQLRGAPSVGKEDNDGDGLPDPDGTGTGMGWFPGYAIDVETGERLNIFFGEASTYGGTEAVDTLFKNKKGPGRDMMFNPTSDFVVNFPGGEAPTGFLYAWNWAFGGQHMVYVSSTRYNECADIKTALETTNSSKVRKALYNLTWAGIVMAKPGETEDSEEVMLSYADGLIPNEARVQLRVNNPYQVPGSSRDFLKADRNGYGTYLFNFNGKSPGDVEDLNKENPLDKVNVVPNPYYAYSEYETSQFNKKVKITNLPGKCTVTIYSIDGKFIKKFDRDERGIDYRASGRSNPGIERKQIYPDLIWDIKNHKGIPVASGVYLIHISSSELGAERTIKWFGINREFDPTGL